MTILVTGANGQLGSELQTLSKMVSGTISKEMEPDTIFSANFLFVDREELDITEGAAVGAYFTEHKPDYCINAAAYTNVEKAEDEREMAHAVNVVGAENVAKACAKYNTILFHISTDFVFDGKKSIPYTEDDEPHPLGAYARTKYEGELAVQEQCPKSFIVRTSWLYSPYGHNFVKSILRRCIERTGSGTNSRVREIEPDPNAKLGQTPFLPVVADQYGSPTYARDLAHALLKMIEYVEMGSGTDLLRKTEPDPSAKLSQTPFPFGVYHYANDGEVTWFEFAQKIRDLAELSCELRPIPASEYPSKVIRPAYSVLSTKKIQTTFGVTVPEWDESLEECVARIA